MKSGDRDDTDLEAKQHRRLPQDDTGLTVERRRQPAGPRCSPRRQRSRFDPTCLRGTFANTAGWDTGLPHAFNISALDWLSDLALRCTHD